MAKKASKRARKKAAAARAPAQWLGVCKYAAHRKRVGLRGHTHGAVQRAILEGRLSASVQRDDSGRARIDVARADVEWSEKTRAAATRPPAGEETTKRNGVPLVPKEQAELFEGALERAQPKPEAPQMRDDLPSLAISTQTSQFYRSRIAELDYRRRAGRLADVEEMEREAREVGEFVMRGLLKIPDRVAALACAITNEGEMRTLLDGEIRSALRALSRGENVPDAKESA